MKLLIVLLLATASLQAVAVDADFSGEYRFRATSGSDSMGSGVIKNLGRNLNSEIRAKVSGSFRPSESFEGVSALYVNLHQLTDASKQLELMDHHAVVAYGDWMISDEFMLRAGQSTYKIADGSVLGINDYEAAPSLYRGLFLTHSSENVGLDMALVQNSTLNDLFIVSVDARSFPDLVKTANFHLIIKDVKSKMGLATPLPVVNLAQPEEDLQASEEASATTAEENNSNSKGVYLGTTLGGGAEGFGYKVTASTDSLTNVLSLSNLLVNGKLSYAIEMDNSTLKAYVGGHMDGSDYEPLLYEKHYNAGKMDRAAWGHGLTYAYGGLAYRTNADWKVGLTGYYFIKSNKENKPEVTHVDDGDVEVDVYVKKHFNSSVSGKLWAGALVPVKGFSMSKSSLKAQAVIQMKF